MSSFDQFMWCLSWISISWFDKKRKEERRLQDDSIFYYLLFVMCYLLFFTFWKFPIKIFSPEKERGEKGTWGCQKGHSEVHSRGRLSKIQFLEFFRPFFCDNIVWPMKEKITILMIFMIMWILCCGCWALKLEDPWRLISLRETATTSQRQIEEKKSINTEKSSRNDHKKL